MSGSFPAQGLLKHIPEIGERASEGTRQGAAPITAPPRLTGHEQMLRDERKALAASQGTSTPAYFASADTRVPYVVE